MNKSIKAFNPLEIAIDGVNLVEASAGTGKTYSIAALFARLIVLEKYTVDQILIVTFTKAAAAELKMRLRLRLNEILNLLESSHSIQREEIHQKDSFLSALFIQLEQCSESREKLIIRLQSALNDFDHAGIYTIHSFCRSVLQDEAFLCGMPFQIEITHNKEKQITQFRDDFWRTKIANNHELSQFCFQTKNTIDTVFNDIKKFIGQPYLHYTAPENRYHIAQQELQSFWQKNQDDILALKDVFFNQLHPVINGTTFNKKSFTNLFTQLKTLYNQNFNTQQIKIELITKLSPDFIKEKTNKNQQIDEKILAKFTLFEELYKYINSVNTEIPLLTVNIKFSLLQYINSALQQAKQHSTERNFDDLLIDVYHALKHPQHGQKLAKRLADTWKIVLIDEFQDTDPLQYDIFKLAFIQQCCPIFLVGDPKQAIYRFRGADIFAYLDAHHDAHHHYTLTSNFRSDLALVDVFTDLFANKKYPFVLPQIEYPQMTANRQVSDIQPTLAALNIVKINNDIDLNKEELKQLAAEACANHIVHLFNQIPTIQYKNRVLLSKDIAILVRSHHEARLMAKILKDHQLHSVLLSQESVFSSDEAQALSALLQYYLTPQNNGILSFILSSCLFQYNAVEIRNMMNDDIQIAQWAEAALSAQEIWKQYGVFTAFQNFSKTTQLEIRLITHKNERILTNIFHLIELLSEEENNTFHETGLLQWLQQQIQISKDIQKNDTNLLRLESDEDLIKIVTIHSAKGLQYPIVYCPFIDCFPSQDLKENIVKTHHQKYTFLKDKNFLSSEETEQIKAELLSENIRLLYVAITRARDSLILFVAKQKADQKLYNENPLYYLLSDITQDPETWQAWQTWYRYIGEPDYIVLSESSPEKQQYQKNNIHKPSYHAMTMTRHYFPSLRYSSFSALSNKIVHKQEEDELTVDVLESQNNALYDANLTVDDNSIFAFPKGIHAGLCLHEILEYFQFNQAADTQQEQIIKILDAYDFDTEKWYHCIKNMLDNTRQALLNTYTHLSGFKTENLLAETSFLMAMQQFDLTLINQWLSTQNIFKNTSLPQAVNGISFDTLKGFLNGFIDMIALDTTGNKLYIIDYKSNHLGYTEQDYHVENLDYAIAKHHYHLQALIYALAIARFMKIRQVHIDTIHIRYLFLRGLKSGTKDGIWQWDIDMASLSILDAQLYQVEHDN